MTSPKKHWVFAPEKRSGKKPKVPATEKAMVKETADTNILPKLKELHVQSPPEQEPKFNYIEEIETKWYRNYFYFISTYRVPHPDAIMPTFEAKFARMEYVAADLYDISFMRYTDEWVPLYGGLTMDECFEVIMTEPHFHP